MARDQSQPIQLGAEISIICVIRGTRWLARRDSLRLIEGGQSGTYSEARVRGCCIFQMSQALCRMTRETPLFWSGATGPWPATATANPGIAAESTMQGGQWNGARRRLQTARRGGERAMTRAGEGCEAADKDLGAGRVPCRIFTAPDTGLGLHL